MPFAPGGGTDFIAYASENPGKLNYGSSGVGGFTHLATEGLDPYINTPEQFAKVVQADLAKWSKVVKQANLKAAQ